MLIKFSIIFVVIYLTAMSFTKIYVSGLGSWDTIRWSLKKYTKKESIWLFIVGLMRLVTILLIPINVIVLVIKYL